MSKLWFDMSRNGNLLAFLSHLVLVGKSAESCQDLSVEAGEILEVFRTTDHPRFPRLSKEKLLTLKNMKGIEIELPLQCKPGFKAVLQRDSCFLAEAVNTQTFPFYARFEAANSQIQTSDRKKLSKFGVIKFEKVYDENIIIASCGHKNVRVVFTVPINIDVTVKVACGALTNDAEYTDLCQEYNNYERIDELAMKQLENELDLKSGEVRGYEYHIKTATEGHFVGFPPEEEENIRNSNKSRSEEMTEKVAKKSRHPYEKIYCMPGKTTKENDQLDEEKLNQDSYGNDLETSQQKMLGNEDSQVDTSLKKPPVKEEVKGYQNHQKRDDSTLESTDEDRPLSSNVDANGIKKEQQHISQNPVKQVYSADKQRVAMKLLTTAKPFTPTLAPKPKKQYQLLAPKELSSTVSSSETTVKKVEGNSSPVPEVPDFQIPDDLSTLDINGICACLKKLNLSKLIETFVENQINGSLLVSLDDEDYKDLGLKSFERKKIMKFAEGWRPDNP